jgi:simple sugar transport system substrate-binding protein
MITGGVDGVMTLGPGGAAPALAALSASGLRGRITVATFDLSPDVLEAVRDGRLLFAVDQQPYLQGYLPIMLLAERARHGLFPARGELIPTGPQFVTAHNAGRVIALSRRGFR